MTKDERNWLVRSEEARRANYRICWAHRLGYFAQWRDGERWANLGTSSHRSEVEARLDCKLAATRAGEECRLHPCIANATPGRPEYDPDPCGPYPWHRGGTNNQD